MKKITKILVPFLLSATLLTVTSCAKSYDSGGDASSPNENNSFVGGVTEKDDAISNVNFENNRKIIKNVNESVQTDRFDEFLNELNQVVSDTEGYIYSSNYSGKNYFNEDNLRHANITIRIPADNLSAFGEKVDSISVVTYYNETVQDVTAAYVDVESRIAVLEAEEAALLEMLKTSATTSDALSVRTRLLDVQADLASLRAQKNTYDDRVAFSTVYMSISEVRRAK